MFTNLEVIKPLPIQVVTGSYGRFYTTPEGKKYPSITTLLGVKEKPWLEEWRTSLGKENAAKETKRTADRGTAVHEMVEKFLKNQPKPTTGYLPEHISEFHSLRFQLRNINNIYAQELVLYSDALQVAGRCDCIAEWNGILTIIDFKTSTNNKNNSMIEDYFLQTTAYALMFQERYNIQIDNIVILMTVEKGILPLIFKRTIENYIEPLINRINTYYKRSIS